MIITDHDYYWKLCMNMFLCVNVYIITITIEYIIKVAIIIGNVQG